MEWVPHDRFVYEYIYKFKFIEITDRVSLTPFDDEKPQDQQYSMKSNHKINNTTQRGTATRTTPTTTTALASPFPS